MPGCRSLSDQEALGVIGRHGYGKPADSTECTDHCEGPVDVSAWRSKRGFSLIIEAFAPENECKCQLWFESGDGEVIGVVDHR